MVLDRQHVYRVRSDTDETVNLALAPQITPQGITWFDTVRERVLTGAVVSNEGDALVFKAARGETYSLHVLTLAEYDADVRPRVELSPAFASDEELHHFYVSHFL